MLLLAATTNKGKLREFSLAASHFPKLRIRALDISDSIPAPEETGDTFEENAAIKALAYSRGTSLPVFADDSGLEVNALNNAPGVLSARYSGPGATDASNNSLLLQRLSAATDRSARFICVIALAQKGQLLYSARGEVAGQITTTPAGAQGFGYDPLFWYPPLFKTFAELNVDEKFAVSHRGKAFQALCTWVDSHFETPLLR